MDDFEAGLDSPKPREAGVSGTRDGALLPNGLLPIVVPPAAGLRVSSGGSLYSLRVFALCATYVGSFTGIAISAYQGVNDKDGLIVPYSFSALLAAVFFTLIMNVEGKVWWASQIFALANAFSYGLLLTLDKPELLDIFWTVIANFYLFSKDTPKMMGKVLKLLDFSCLTRLLFECNKGRSDHCCFILEGMRDCCFFLLTLWLAMAPVYLLTAHEAEGCRRFQNNTIVVNGFPDSKDPGVRLLNVLKIFLASEVARNFFMLVCFICNLNFSLTALYTLKQEVLDMLSWLSHRCGLYNEPLDNNMFGILVKRMFSGGPECSERGLLCKLLSMFGPPSLRVIIFGWVVWFSVDSQRGLVGHIVSTMADWLLPLAVCDLLKKYLWLEEMATISRVFLCIKRSMMALSFFEQMLQTGVEFLFRGNCYQEILQVRGSLKAKFLDDVKSVRKSYDECCCGAARRVCALLFLNHVSTEIFPLAANEQLLTAPPTEKPNKFSRANTRLCYGVAGIKPIIFLFILVAIFGNAYANGKLEVGLVAVWNNRTASLLINILPWLEVMQGYIATARLLESENSVAQARDDRMAQNGWVHLRPGDNHEAVGAGTEDAAAPQLRVG